MPLLVVSLSAGRAGGSFDPGSSKSRTTSGVDPDASNEDGMYDFITLNVDRIKPAT